MKSKLHFIIIYLSILCSQYSFADNQPPKPQLILAKTYQVSEDTQLSDYLVSEKFDGVRGFWDGKTLRTRGGVTINAPDWFIKQLPKQIQLDGELWMGYHSFAKISGLLRSHSPNNQKWQEIQFLIFEAPNLAGDFQTRINTLKKKLEPLDLKQVKVINQETINDQATLKKRLNEVLEKGGEGLILHLKKSPYKTGRSNDLLKVKPYQDAEATVIGYTKGKGKYQGFVGALILRTHDGKVFKAGSGLSDEDRKKPPSIGTIVTYKYYGLTKNGLPRHPIFMRVRPPIE